jgi:hypothetical protein
MADQFPPAPQSYASPYTPSLRERLIAAMQNAVGGTANQRGTASDFAENAGNVLGMVPGVSNVLGADDAVRQYQSGHPFQAALTGAMALPIPAANAAEGAAEGPVQKLVKAITAYHGSPHSFDQFDMSKIGTGEGAQAYGHGLYFAGNEQTARNYRDVLGADAVKVGDQTIIPQPGSPEAMALSHLTSAHIQQFHNPYAQARLSMREQAQNEPHNADLIGNARNVLDQWQDAGATPTTGGHMYQVGINADPEHFLDWDKPLSEQSTHVQSSLRNSGLLQGDLESEMRNELHQRMNSGSGYDEGPALHNWYQELRSQKDLDDAAQDRNWDMQRVIEGWWDKGDSSGERSAAFDPTGQQIHQQIAQRLTENPNIVGSVNQPTTAEQLSNAGIPGIKYLDQGSRAGGGDPTHNYVVFNDDLVNILKKYGLAGAGGAAGAAALMNQPQPAQAGQFPQAPPQ